MRHLNRAGTMLLVVLSLSTMAPSPIALGADPAVTPSANAGKILILPFGALNQSDYQSWLGRSIQQSLAADLTVIAAGRLMSDDREVTDDAAAVGSARKQGAKYVVYGSFAVAGELVRATGDVLDVDLGRSIGALKATGPVADIFVIEDALGVQVRRLVSPESVVADTNLPAASIPPFQPVQLQPQPAPNPYEQEYGSPSGNGVVQANAARSNAYYYDSSGADAPVLAWGAAWGYPAWGFGLSYAVPYGYSTRSVYHCPINANNRWNGSYAAGIATTGNGTPLAVGAGVNFAATGSNFSSGGVRLGTVGISIGGGGRGIHAGSVHAGGRAGAGHR